MNRRLGIIWICVASLSASSVVAQDASAGGEWNAAVRLPNQFNGTKTAYSYGIDDHTGDGISEILELRSSSGVNDTLFCLDSGTAQPLWSMRYPPPAYSDEYFKLTRDRDGDGVRDLLSLAGRFYPERDLQLMSSATGALLWSAFDSGVSPDIFPCSSGSRVALLGDVDADGFREFGLVEPSYQVGNHGYGVLVVYDGRTGAERFRVYAEPLVYFATDVEVTLDHNADGVMDILVALDRGNMAVQVRSGIDGALLDEFPVTSNYYAQFTPFLSDLDGDGRAEIVITHWRDDLGQSGAEYGSIRCYSSRNGALLWEATGGSPAERFATSVALGGDYDEDLIPDLVVFSPGKRSKVLGQKVGGVRVISGATGERIRSYTSERSGQELRWLRGNTLGDGITPKLTVWYQEDLGLGNFLVEYVDLWLEPKLRGPSEFWSAGLGVSEYHRLDFGADMAGAEYRYLISRTGTGEWDVPGVVIPLEVDAWVRRGVAGTGYPGFFATAGQLDQDGRAAITVQLPPGVISSLIGETIAVAAVVEHPVTGERASSIAWSIQILQ